MGMVMLIIKTAMILLTMKLVQTTVTTAARTMKSRAGLPEKIGPMASARKRLMPTASVPMREEKTRITATIRLLMSEDQNF